MEQAVIWILGIIAFIILETVTYQLVSIWFAIGALGGMIAVISGVISMFKWLCLLRYHLFVYCVYDRFQ